VVTACGLLCSFGRKARKTEVLDWWRFSSSRRGRKFSHCVWNFETWQANIFQIFENELNGTHPVEI